MEFKRRNPSCGCPRIVQQISDTFDIELKPDVARRILVHYFKPGIDSDGPSWLTFLGHSKNSLWSMDFFTSESVLVRSYSVMVVMDQFSRRIIGFAVHRGQVNGEALCRIFRGIVSDIPTPDYLSMDNDRLYLFEDWAPLLEVLSINPIQSISLIPVSYPFVERLIGTVRREYVDQLFFWNSRDLQHKLEQFQDYFIEHRVHAGIDGDLPNRRADEIESRIVSLENYSWESHCNGLFQIPRAA